MIGSLTGTPTFVGDKYALIDVNGVGYKVYATKDTLVYIEKEDTVSLFTYLVVKEDALDLYAFETISSKDFFELLITVSGVGPKGALGILSLAHIDTLKKAIISGDIGYLTSVSGIGKKTGEKIIIELRDKIKDIHDSVSGFSLHGESDVVEALKTLGYSAIQVREALTHISEDITDTNSRIKEALKILGK